VIKGIPLLKEEDALSHLQIVDDNILLGSPTVKEVTGFKSLLDLFNLASGTVINQEKYQFFFFNTPHNVQKNLFNLLGFPISTLPAKYLGAPLLLKSHHNPSWETILEKMEYKLGCWTHHSLSFPWRVLWIKSVLSSLLVYLFSLLAAR
jgi:hypothetical protein